MEGRELLSVGQSGRKSGRKSGREVMGGQRSKEARGGGRVSSF